MTCSGFRSSEAIWVMKGYSAFVEYTCKQLSCQSSIMCKWNVKYTCRKSNTSVLMHSDYPEKVKNGKTMETQHWIREFAG